METQRAKRVSKRLASKRGVGVTTAATFCQHKRMEVGDPEAITED
jgi:hypothetical protein